MRLGSQMWASSASCATDGIVKSKLDSLGRSSFDSLLTTPSAAENIDDPRLDPPGSHLARPPNLHLTLCGTRSIPSEGAAFSWRAATMLFGGARGVGLLCSQLHQVCKGATPRLQPCGGCIANQADDRAGKAGRWSRRSGRSGGERVAAAAEPQAGTPRKCRSKLHCGRS